MFAVRLSNHPRRSSNTQRTLRRRLYHCLEKVRFIFRPRQTDAPRRFYLGEMDNDKNILLLTQTSSNINRAP